MDSNDAELRASESFSLRESQIIPLFFLYSSILIDLFVGPELEADTVVTGFKAMLVGTVESCVLQMQIYIYMIFNEGEF